MTEFEPEYKSFELQTQSHQLSNTFQLTMTEVYETLEAVDVDTTSEYY